MSTFEDWVPLGLPLVDALPMEPGNAPDVDPFGLPLLPVERVQESVVAVAVTSQGTVSVSRLVSSLGWVSPVEVGAWLRPDWFGVVVRPIRVGDSPDVLLWLESKNRVRLRGGVLPCLGVARTGGPVVFFGRRVDESWVLLLLNPRGLEPGRWWVDV